MGCNAHGVLRFWVRRVQASSILRTIMSKSFRYVGSGPQLVSVSTSSRQAYFCFVSPRCNHPFYQLLNRFAALCFLQVYEHTVKLRSHIQQPTDCPQDKHFMTLVFPRFSLYRLGQGTSASSKSTYLSPQLIKNGGVFVWCPLKFG